MTTIYMTEISHTLFIFIYSNSVICILYFTWKRSRIELKSKHTGKESLIRKITSQSQDTEVLYC